MVWVLVMPMETMESQVEHEKTPLVGEGDAMSTGSALESAACAGTHVSSVLPYTG